MVRRAGIDAVDAIGIEALLLDQLGKRLQIGHGDLPDFGPGFVAAFASAWFTRNH